MDSDQIAQIDDYLYRLLKAQAAPPGIQWLDKKLADYRADPVDRRFYLTFGAIPRFIGKDDLTLTEQQLHEAQSVRTGFQPQGWSLDQIARSWLMLQLDLSDPAAFVTKIETLFSTADVREQEALYRSLPLLPFPERFVARASEGVRTNITSVFDAIALDNPFPADHMSTDAWNQMVLKAVFMARPIYRIYGLEKRANAPLAQIISDYAHERWAAGRVVSPEFWRPVGPFLTSALLPDIERLFQTDHPLQQQAAALVCHDSASPAAQALLQRHPTLQARIENGELTWDALALDWWAGE